MIEHLRIRTQGISLHAAVAGPADGPLVILLHGFPEFWFGWRRAIDPLVERGFRVIIPDQRGYNISDKPSGVAAYGLTELGKDVVGLIDWAGKDKAHLVGHDWGAAVAWWFATAHPERLDKLVAINVPHPVVLERFLRSDPGQLRRSWYMLLFQLPRAPEAIFRAGDGRRMAEAMANSGRPGAFSEEELERYRQSWREKGAATAMINWYRAGLRARPPWPSELSIQAPTLVIWGKQDPLLKLAMAEQSLALCAQGRLEVIEEATHWVVHEAPERVHQLILQHLGARD